MCVIENEKREVCRVLDGCENEISIFSNAFLFRNVLIVIFFNCPCVRFYLF